MGKSGIDPQGAVRDMFGGERQPEAAPQAGKTRSPNTTRRIRPETAVPEPRYLTVDEVARRFRVGRATIWRWVKTNSDFPAPVKLSPGTTRWREDHLHAFERGAE